MNEGKKRVDGMGNCKIITEVTNCAPTLSLDVGLAKDHGIERGNLSSCVQLCESHQVSDVYIHPWRPVVVLLNVYRDGVAPSKPHRWFTAKTIGFHPHSDCQTEQVNQELKFYLRC